jgi:ADP-ribose pyrophosphatase YjhB (NUDIX family)
MARTWTQPVVGIGILLVNDKGKILVGRRKVQPAPKYSIFGGGLEMGETFEEAAIREAKEETNLDIRNPKVFAITNNIDTYKEEGKHSISVMLVSHEFSGELKLMEPDKCESWFWCDPKELPHPHYDASRIAVECYLTSKFYINDQL